MAGTSAEFGAEEDQSRGAEADLRFRSASLTLTFEDEALEDAFCRKLDDQNVWPATLCLSLVSVSCLAYWLLASPFWDDAIADQTTFRALIAGSYIVTIVGSGLLLLLLRRRHFSCEMATILGFIMFTVTLFTSHIYYMAEIFNIPGDFLPRYYRTEPRFVLALALINGALHAAINVRCSRSWILPVFQVSILGAFRSLLAPWPAIDTFFLCFMFSSANYLSWRGRRNDERRARMDHLEKHELRLAMTQERESSSMQKQRLQEIEDRLRAMDAWAGQRLTEVASQSVSAYAGRSHVKPSHEQDLTVPLPQRCRDPAFSCQTSADVADIAVPNELLHRAMSGRSADAALIRKMAKQITSSEYDIRQFFEDAVEAFPELELFFTGPADDFAKASPSTPARSQRLERAKGEKEYQRTIGALFSVYWMLRLDSDGKEGFCLGVASDWEQREIAVAPTGVGRLGSISSSSKALAGVGRLGSSSSSSSSSVQPSMSLPGGARRLEFLESADWAKMREMVTLSVGGADGHVDTERVEAMLCLTAVHDVLKMEWLCPQVTDAHGPYKGYAAGASIHDHDVALSYVMEHYPELLPSYSNLPPRMQKLVLFTQSKMQFNHGWFVQAEAPPGLMLGPLKSCLAAAQPGDLPFYFFHWLTDLSGAEGTPMGGAEKFVLKFPEPVLAAFTWSIPYLDHLAGETETQVMERYLVARWQSMFPDVLLPTGPSTIALLRLVVMAQGEAGIVAEAFHTLTPCARAILSEELARTGCEDQHFECWPLRGGGPALLIYYGPALLQRCRGVDEMRTGLQILAATVAGGRGLWPLSAKSQGSTVVIDIGPLRMHDVKDILGSPVEAHRSVWVMTPKNEREATLELLHAGEINQMNCSGHRYWVLDEPPGIDDDYDNSKISC